MAPFCLLREAEMVKSREMSAARAEYLTAATVQDKIRIAKSEKVDLRRTAG
jgi:hypothetical protein